MIDEGQSDSADENYTGRSGRGAETVGSGGSEGSKFGDVGWNTGYAYSTCDDSVSKDRNAAGIHGIGIAVINLRFSSDDAEPSATRERERRLNSLAGKITGGKRAPAIGIFDSIEVGGRGIVDARWKVNTTDKANGAGGKRGLIVAEIGGAPCQGYGQIIYINRSAEISNGGGGGRGLAKNSKNFSATIDNSDHHSVEIDRGRCGHNDILHVKRAESGDSHGRRNGARGR